MQNLKLDWYDSVLAVLDFEATGPDPTKDRAVQVALVVEAPGGYVLPHSFFAYINPGEEGFKLMEQSEASSVNNLDRTTLESNGVSPLQAFTTLLIKLNGLVHLNIPLVIYNAVYDWRLFHYECSRLALPKPPSLPIVDPLLIDYQVDKYRKGSRKLVATAQHYRLKVDEAKAHDAVYDCILTAEVARQIVRKYSRLKSYSLQELQRLQRRWYKAWAEARNRYWARIGEDKRIDCMDWPGV